MRPTLAATAGAAAGAALTAAILHAGRYTIQQTQLAPGYAATIKIDRWTGRTWRHIPAVSAGWTLLSDDPPPHILTAAQPDGGGK